MHRFRLLLFVFALIGTIPSAAIAAPATDQEMPTEGTKAGRSGHGRPATIKFEELAIDESLDPRRLELIKSALKVAAESPWLPYKFGGSTPSDGGFDCSGAMHYVMQQIGLKPPRTSADQFNWVKKGGKFVEVKPQVRALDDPVFQSLKPGDLLFWSGTYIPTDGRTSNITHVAIYLGKESKDGRQVMINATDGRSYRGRKANGFGVYDFRIPREGSRSRFIGFGPPPGLVR